MNEAAIIAALIAPVLVAALALAGWRLVRGPSFADRFIALDMLTAIAVGFCAVAALGSGSAAFLDVGLGVALVNFVATVGAAVFLERQGEDG